MAAIRRILSSLSPCKCTATGFTSPLISNRKSEWLHSGRHSYLYMEQVRKSSFLTHLTADALWKGVTTVSNPGKKKGRGRGIGKKVAKDLNRGQIIGSGKINVIWPGLNAPVIKGREVVEQQLLPSDPNRAENLLKVRTQQASFKRLKLDSLERGFSGIKLPGRSCGPPDPVKEGTFEGFDSKILEFRSRSVMSGQFGRQRQTSALVVTGNKNGLGGFGWCVGKDGATTVRRAKNLAGKTLRYVERYEEHTVIHDFHVRYNHTDLFVQKKEKGYGLDCNRFLRVVCELIGITDIRVKLEGSTNPLMITNAFFLGLKQQKTHQELADMIGLNVVEFREECDNYPRLIAAPKTRCRTREEIPANEITDYDEVINEGKILRYFGRRLDDVNKQKKRIYQRNFKDVRYRLLAKHGEYKSFYNYNEEERINKEKIQTVTDQTS